MQKQLCYNKKARFEYFIEETYEAGIVLEGSEVKSLRDGNCSLGDSFCYIKGGEVFVRNMHIGVYKRSAAFNTRDPKRDRKLLLNRREINKIAGKINEKGETLIPLSVYLKDNLIKVEVALCKGKHTYDKKRVLAEKDAKREAEREIKKHMGS
ncbi:MAG: SsrA-binding protein SmpB [Clostridia bacterium]|nr:SsrA-binding protein SmpB [Clostridia bacterium]